MHPHDLCHVQTQTHFRVYRPPSLPKATNLMIVRQERVDPHAKINIETLHLICDLNSRAFR